MESLADMVSDMVSSTGTKPSNQLGEISMVLRIGMYANYDI